MAPESAAAGDRRGHHVLVLVANLRAVVVLRLGGLFRFTRAVLARALPLREEQRAETAALQLSADCRGFPPRGF